MTRFMIGLGQKRWDRKEARVVFVASVAIRLSVCCEVEWRILVSDARSCGEIDITEPVSPHRNVAGVVGGEL